MGGLPSSRLTRILQEKAEALKKQRQSAEAVLREAEDQIQKLEQLGIVPEGVTERLQTAKELQRRSDWEALETQAKGLLEYLSKTVPANLEARRGRMVEALGRLSGLGIAVPTEVSAEIDALAHPPAGESPGATVGRMARVEEALKKAESDHIVGRREQALRVARWAELSPARFSEFERRLDDAVLPAKEGRVAESRETIDRLIREGLPEAVERRRRIREASTTLVSQAKEYGATSARLEATLDADLGAQPSAWPETVPAVEQAFAAVGEALREKCLQALQGLKSSVEATVDYGVDPEETRQRLDEAVAKLAQALPLDIVPTFADARRSAEEPVVTVIAGILDEVRPRIVEARRLGRDPSEIFASMNRAREALRLKIYSEAFAAAQEALDRVRRLTEDLDGARDELQALEEMLERFRRAGFSTDPFAGPLGRVRTHLDRAEVAPARELLRETVVRLGREALQFFLARWNQLEKTREYAREHGFLSPEVDREIVQERELLDRGELAEAAERIARSEVALRTAAAPIVARRVEEMEQGLSEITDEALTAPVRRLLADADVTLRVKEDLYAALESLQRAERDFAAVFAAHASSLVEVLEAEGKVLESMGGTSDEIQRQIDEVQQIFNMEDFVKASRASQEIRTRAQQQQLLRGEEAVSHAKLSLVELETMGLDLANFRTQLDEAQAATRAGRSLDAYKIATKLEETAGRARATAHELLDGIVRAQDVLGRIRESGADPAPFYEPLRNARLAVQSLDFDNARALLEGVQQQLADEGARLETTHFLAEIALLIEDGRRLSAPMEPFAARLEQLKTERATAPPEATRVGVRNLHEELIAILRPILEENLRALERDLDVARAAGVDLAKIVGPLSEARRRIALAVPVGAAALLDAAQAELISTRGFVDQAELVTKRARDSLAQADLLHVDAVAQRQAMERLEQLLEVKQYARVIELGGSLERDFLQVTYQHVSKTLAGFQATVTRIRHSGVDTSLAENLLHQARMALDEGRPVEALRIASRSESELERAELQRRIAEGSIEATGRSIDRSHAEGIVAPVAEEEFRLAKSAFEGHVYPDVLERALVALDALSLARDGHRRAVEAVSGADRQIAEAVQNGADVAEATRRLSEGRQFLDLGQYSEAIRAGRESTEKGRWAIERLFAAPLAELRRQVESARQNGLTSEVDPLDALVTEGEGALRGQEWSRVRDTIQRGDQLSQHTFEAVVDGRWRQTEAEYGRTAPPSTAEATRREALRRQLEEARARRDFAGALSLVRGELGTAQRRHREEIEGRMALFKDRLWVGERLGIDTTPVMQTFSEARVAIDAGRLDEAESILARATTALEPTVREPYRQRMKDVQTELRFAEEGLHVSVGLVRQRLQEVEEVERSGGVLDACRLLLKAEEELNLRKSLHRELMNIHYLIDAALARAQERRLDTSAARALLSESIRLRETDYPAALEKARQALRKLQEEGAVTPEMVPAPAAGSTPFWPFRRPPAEP